MGELNSLLPLPLAGEGWGEGLQRQQNLLQHSFSLRQHLVIPKAQGGETRLAHEGLTLLVLRKSVIFVVLSSVKLNDHAGFQTGEICEVRTDGALPAKLQTQQLAITQVLPEQDFSVGLVMAQLPGSLHPHPSPLPHAGEGA